MEMVAQLPLLTVSKFFADSDLVVIIRSSTGTETTKTLTTHYTVTGAGSASGGTVVFYEW
jgi:hypothetical protein